MRRRFDILAILCLAGATISWGTVPVFMKALTHHIPDGFTTNAIRYPLASLIYLPLFIQGVRRRTGGRFWLAALLPAIVNLIGQTLWAIAPYYISAGMVAFLFRLSAIWGILGAFWLFPDERQLARSPLFWWGTLLAIGGFVILSWDSLTQMSGASWTGLVLMFFCGICYGMYGVTVRYVMGTLNPLFVFAVVGTYTSVGLIVLAPMGEPSSLVRMSGTGWVLAILSAVIGISLAHGIYYTAVQRIGAAVSMLMLSVTPFVTILTSWLFLDERFSASQWIGGTILVVGATVAMAAQQRLPNPPLPDPHEMAHE